MFGELACTQSTSGGQASPNEANAHFLAYPLTFAAPVQNGWQYAHPPNAVNQYHKAVDFGSYDAASAVEAQIKGSNVLSPCAGYAMATSQYASGKGYGRFVLVRCDQIEATSSKHYYVILAHLASSASGIPVFSEANRFSGAAKCGNSTPGAQCDGPWASVEVGTVVGAVGKDDTSWYHSHFEVFVGDYSNKKPNRRDPYDLYKLTTAGDSAETHYNAGGANWAGCGDNNLWITCPPQPGTSCACNGGTCCSNGCSYDGSGTSCGTCKVCDGSGSCGNAANGSACTGGTCQNGSCTPTCACTGGTCCSNACNYDGAGTSCGTCKVCNGSGSCGNAANGSACTGGTCQNGSCSPTCACTGGTCCSNACNYDGAGTSCGTCKVCNGSGSCGNAANGSACTGGTCQNGSCTPSCSGCLSGGVCQSGTTNTACGSGGGTCQSCGGLHWCANQSCATCTIHSVPSAGTFTSAFTANTNCTCSATNTSCHTLYRARVDSIAADGWHANLSFQKADGSTISAGLQYWVTVGPATPSCWDINGYLNVIRAHGTVSTNTSTLSVTNVPIWPDQATYDADAPGTTKYIFVMTDGSGVLGTPTWIEKDALAFTKSCP
jgi:hypothetical protein